MLQLWLVKVVTEIVDSEETGSFARQLRKERGISLAVLSQQMGVSVSYLANLECGNRRWNENLVSRFNEAIEACSPSS